MDTGLPELPKGYFWRVTKSTLFLSGRDTLCVSICKRHGNWFSRFLMFKDEKTSVVVSNAVLSTHNVPMYTEEAIAFSAKKTLRQWEQDKEIAKGVKAKKAEIHAVMDQFVGDYPPKKL